MDHELNKASRRLSELTLTCEMSSCSIDVQWFRVMQKSGDWTIPRHSHKSFEFHIIASGSCLVTTDTNSFTIGEGQFYITGPSVYHEQTSSNKEDLIEYSLDCKFRPRKESGSDSSGECSDLQEFFLNNPCAPFKDTSGVIGLFDQALQEALTLKPGYKLIIQSIVPQLLVAMGRSMGYGYAVNGTSAKSRMDIIADFVADNLYRSIAPSDIASHLNLSEKQVSRIVFASEGFSTKRFITLAKIELAKELLATNSHTLSEIASDLGFTNVSYFSNVFKNHTGMTPGSFRTNAQLQLDIHNT